MKSKSTGAEGKGLLVPGRNCWRIERANRLGFLVDGADYFKAVRAAIAQAQRSVFIVGWDIDSRIRLVPDGANDGLPEELGDFLNEVVKRRPHLRMYVLSWDFAMVFAMDREWMPIYKLDWRTHRRLSFRLDDKHPTGASHHQKIVVVDDAVAFVGGLDLTHCRWDTPEHSCDNTGRCDPDGKPYRPYHDVQAIVDGGPARALGELARDRWHRATGRKPRPVDESPANDPWPPGLQPDLTDVDVAIARTDPGYVTGRAIEEIRHLYVDAIGAARRSMYLENQYFSSSVVGAALAARLREQDSADILVVSRRSEEGWLEERTMGVLRSRLHKQLQAADVGGHYGLYYPHVPALQLPNVLNVHSKVLIVDDALCSVGSANFSNRSMGFDTECNIAIEARGDERIEKAIAGLRNRLLGEHLGTSPETVAAETARRGGRLITAVEALRRPGERTLEPINPDVAPEIDALVPASAVVDPERPVNPDELVKEFVPATARKPVAGRVARIAITFVALAVIAAVWRWTPLREWIAIDSLVRMAHALQDSPIAPLAVLAGYVVAGLLVVPVTALIIATGIVFGPLLGGVYALAGALLSAAVTYWIGAHLGRNAVRHLAGHGLNRITKRLARKGVFAIAVIRLLPIAPYSVVNVVIGASHIRLRDFLLGTALGMAPGIAITVIFVDRVTKAVTDPGFGTFAAVALLAAGVVAAALYVNRRFARPAVMPAAERI
ncbi:MAG: rane protein [Betaproteobacteria bacterium]|nr:rane protein [Betaproteobacteria bacterium]